MTTPGFSIQITAVLPTKDKPTVWFLIHGPVLPINENPDIVRNAGSALMAAFIHKFTEAQNKALPSLPENFQTTPAHLNTARVWLAQVEAGKSGAVCTAWETEDGKRHILIETKRGD